MKKLVKLVSLQPVNLQKKKKGEKTYITNINKETISLQNVKKNQKNNYRNTMKNYHQI